MQFLRNAREWATPQLRESAFLERFVPLLLPRCTRTGAFRQAAPRIFNYAPWKQPRTLVTSSHKEQEIGQRHTVEYLTRFHLPHIRNSVQRCADARGVRGRGRSARLPVPYLELVKPQPCTCQITTLYRHHVTFFPLAMYPPSRLLSHTPSCLCLAAATASRHSAPITLLLTSAISTAISSAFFAASPCCACALPLFLLSPWRQGVG